ncbi:hypothetical protein A3A09_00235 [Candidatus Nomurabacteria bacterium RIFCSPLOWO2_01_FULL_42_20]|nr:MAG: hypothetical protein A3A09_00235 [Candidatus Nomurabacteria bacterium RIFCSPLOWO2_01_FULL_42_20]
MENEEIKTLLEANLKLSKENNKLLHKVRGVQKKHYFFLGLRWLVIIALLFGAYYYIQPYLKQIVEVYNSIPNLGKIDIGNIEGLIEGLRP